MQVEIKLLHAVIGVHMVFYTLWGKWLHHSAQKLLLHAVTGSMVHCTHEGKNGTLDEAKGAEVGDVQVTQSSQIQTMPHTA